MTNDIRKAEVVDLAAVQALYTATAATGGLARKPEEITTAYIEGFLRSALASGLSLVAENDGRLLGEIHGMMELPEQFAHVLSNLTIAVHPEAQGQGLGRRLFEAFISQARLAYPRLKRIELGCRESNARAIALYESLGFVIEGRLKSRVYDPSGVYEDDLVMGLLLR